MKKLQELLAKLGRDEKGATVIEYALIAALIAVVAIVGFKTLGTTVSTTLGTVNSGLGGTAP
ncbi:MAG: Flp family type IVb pilin [Paraperlucidibaca sp.]